jgi:aryl-alcohol dehydrogenase-like predicted oxidoreductase
MSALGGGTLTIGCLLEICRCISTDVQLYLRDPGGNLVQINWPESRTPARDVASEMVHVQGRQPQDESNRWASLCLANGSWTTSHVFELRRDELDSSTFESRHCHPSPLMKNTRLGRSELLVSQIAFGTWQLGGDWGATDEETAVAAMRRAADRGINFFDTAQAYGFGASESLLAKAFKGSAREDVVIATKGGLRPMAGGGIERDASPDWIRRGVDSSLKALDTDYIDLYQVHWPDPKVPFAETAGALADVKAAGKVRHVGVSNYGAAEMAEFSRSLPVETIQPAYHMFRRDIEKSVLPYAKANDIGVLAYGPLGHGLLSGALTAETRFAPGDWRSRSEMFRGDSYRRNLRVVSALQRFAQLEFGTSLSRLAIAWVLAHPAVQVAIVGTRNPKHIDDAIAAADLQLDASALRRIREIISDGVRVAGPSPESVQNQKTR